MGLQNVLWRYTFHRLDGRPAVIFRIDGACPLHYGRHKVNEMGRGVNLPPAGYKTGPIGNKRRGITALKRPGLILPERRITDGCSLLTVGCERPWVARRQIIGR